MVQMNLLAGQEKRQRCREWTYGHEWGGRRSWGEVREWHGHIYTTKCKIDS